MDVGWAWYPSLEMCGDSHLSLEFLTKKADGTLLYNGPMTPPEEEALITDFISLELEAGNPRLLIDFGSGTLELKIKPPRRLDDGDWHRLDVFWDTENVRMVLDLCRFAPIHEPEDGSTALFNTTLCEVKGQVPPFNEYLDVNARCRSEASPTRRSTPPSSAGITFRTARASADASAISSTTARYCFHRTIFHFRIHFNNDWVLNCRFTIWRSPECGKAVSPDAPRWMNSAPETKYPGRG